MTACNRYEAPLAHEKALSFDTRCRTCQLPPERHRPTFPQHKLEEMRKAARAFDRPIGTIVVDIPPPTAFIAFRRPTIEDEFFARVLHCDPCEKISPMFYPGRKCGGCIAEERLHDPGDEDAKR